MEKKKSASAVPVAPRTRIAELVTKALSSTPRIVENYSAAIEATKTKATKTG